MAANVTIVSVEREAGYGLILTFSDGTTGKYVVEELLELRPYRHPQPLTHENGGHLALVGAPERALSASKETRYTIHSALGLLRNE